jgi:anti-sigma factor RsiW
MTEDRPYITCQELLDFLYLYLEDELPPHRRHEFERHLAVCEPCRNYIRQYELTIRLGKVAHGSADAGSSAPEDTPEQLVQAILRSRAGN